MKRVLYDVPRWHVYLHRDSRGLENATERDTPVTKFEDEVFDRLYSGESRPALPEGPGPQAQVLGRRGPPRLRGAPLVQAPRGRVPGRAHGGWHRRGDAHDGAPAPDAQGERRAAAREHPSHRRRSLREGVEGRGGDAGRGGRAVGDRAPRRQEHGHRRRPCRLERYALSLDDSRQIIASSRSPCWQAGSSASRHPSGARRSATAPTRSPTSRWAQTWDGSCRPNWSSSPTGPTGCCS